MDGNGPSVDQQATTAPPVSAATAKMFLRPSQYQLGQDFELWLARFNNYASSVPEAERRNVLLSFLDDKAYQAASNLETGGTFKTFQDALIERFRPSSSTADLQTQFLALTQNNSQSVADYADALLVAARRAFSNLDSKAREELVKGRFLSGLRDSDVRMQTLLNPQSTFAETLKTARFVESVHSQGGAAATALAAEAPEALAVGIQRSLQELSEKVSRLEGKDREHGGSGRRINGKPVTCWRCGRPGHVQKFCKQQKSGNGNGTATAGTPFHY